MIDHVLKRRPIFLTIVAAIALYIVPDFYGALANPSDDGPEYVVLPGIFRAPETGLGGGVGLFILNKPMDGQQGSRGNSLRLGTVYTEKKQFVARAVLERFINNHRDHLLISANAQQYPDSFFGVGGNTKVEDEEKYISYEWDTQIRYLHEFTSSFYFGGQGNFLSEKISTIKQDGFLNQKKDQNGHGIIGTEPMHLAGVGVLTRWDTRDDLQDPDKGHFIESGFISRSKFLGSDHEFNTFNFDARWFLPLSNTDRPIRMALNAVVVSHDGNPPFQALAALGGRDILRGYFLGRYRDRQLLAIQSELRAPLGAKWGIVGYIGAGNVSKEWQGMLAREFKPAAGTGLRYRVADAHKVNLRLDFAWGRDTPNPSYYLSLAEAF
jgi:outer membrane protein assembly factor BamA